jgi:hydroxymethylbilane synthase
MKEIRIATRASKLALAQANQTMNQLASLAPNHTITLVKISTKGDTDKSDFLYKSDSSTGFFTSEVEKALLDGRADVAVHSLKDLPTAITDGLTISAIPPREQVNDVIVASKKITSIQNLPEGATVGTSSLRRITQLKLIRPDLKCQPLRGNVETRINKVKAGQVDAIVIARAGLNRLDLSGHISLILAPEDFIPAPGQGALAIQTREEDQELCNIVSKLEDPHTRLTVEAERRILAGLHGGCSIPLGVYAFIEHDTLHIHAILSNLATTTYIRKRASSPLNRALETADRLTQEILNEGGEKMLAEIRSEKSQ